MSYIEFVKEQLTNIDFSKSREILRCSRTGSFAATTLVGLNTRKYHGLFIVPQDGIDHERHVLVSNLNETILINNMEFRLSVHEYRGEIIDPKGNKYLQKFNADRLPTYYFRVGKFNFTKEVLFLNNADRLIIKYTILDNYESASFQFQPLLAFRQIHHLTHENNRADTRYRSVVNGVGYCLYDCYTPVYFQCSEKIAYTHDPQWVRDVEYEEELRRGYEGYEDLLAPGYITAPVQNRELYISIGTEPIKPEEIASLFKDEAGRHTSRSSFFNCLRNAAEQFIVQRNGKTEIMAGYPWFGRWGRDTFIALPGLTLALDKPELCKRIMDDMIAEMKEGLFPNTGEGDNAGYNAVDAPLWFFRTLQIYAETTHTRREIWKEYGTTMKQILTAYRNGTLHHIKRLDNGLIYAGGPGLALTWMDAIVDGQPVTPRTGCQVEINALWYNAVKFSIEMAHLAKDTEFETEWTELIQDFPTVFKETFWSKEMGYLADYVDGDYRNFQVRPNMMIVTSLPFTPISEKIRQLILKRTIEELLTDKGIRSLSPKDAEYRGHYGGNQSERDLAYHQGTCWIWLYYPFTDGMLAVYGKSALPVLEKLLYNFDSCMKMYGISTIAEITDGDPPHKPNGCISQAWSIAALLYLKWRIDSYASSASNKKKKS